MYVPRHFSMPDALVREVLAQARTAEWVTAHETGPVATLLPVTWHPATPGSAGTPTEAGPDAAGFGSLVTHVARVNPLWHQHHLGDVLAILAGPDAYVDPDWYPSNERSPGVPTWNYATVHAYGDLIVHDDPDWTAQSAWELSERHGYPAGRVREDAAARLARAIVGLELRITRVEAKAKLSQNRSPADVAGAADGVRDAGNDDLADLMERVALPHARAREDLVERARQRLGEGRPR